LFTTAGITGAGAFVRFTVTAGITCGPGKMGSIACHTTLPPTIVKSTLAFKLSSTGHFMTSKSTMMRSASLPGSNEPFCLSSKFSHALL
jgi:hypothetical protein